MDGAPIEEAPSGSPSKPLCFFVPPHLFLAMAESEDNDEETKGKALGILAQTQAISAAYDVLLILPLAISAYHAPIAAYHAPISAHHASLTFYSLFASCSVR